MSKSKEPKGKYKNLFKEPTRKLEVLPVLDPTEKDDWGMDIHPNLPQIGGFGGGSLTLLIGAVKTGKCLFEYSLVETDKGNKYIKNVIVGDKVLSDNGFVEVDKVFKQGKKECYKIILENDFELILTEDHNLHTLNGMKPMKDCNNEMIITKNGMKKIKSKEYYNKVECYDVSVKNDNHRFYCNDISVSNSTLISNMFLNDNFFGQECFDYVKIMSNTISNDITSRFLKEAFDVDDTYDDSIVSGIIENQKKYEKAEQPKIAIICDDLLGSVPRNGLLWSLCSRYRHYNIRMLLISSQNYKKVDPVARQNCQNLIITSPFPNFKEMMKIADEFGDVVGGYKQFLKIYKYATPNRYDILHMDLQSNPVKCYGPDFNTLIAEGSTTYFDEGSVDIGEFEGGGGKNESAPKEDI